MDYEEMNPGRSKIHTCKTHKFIVQNETMTNDDDVILCPLNTNKD